MKINLGCGYDIRKGYTNVDYQEIEGVDIVKDINDLPLPFDDDYATEIICQDILEHINDIPKTMMELARISKEGCKVFIRVPHFTSRNVWSDLEHKRGFNWDSFNTNHFVLENFVVVHKEITFSKLKSFMMPIANTFPILFENYIRFFSAANLEVVLIRKSDSQSINKANEVRK